MYLVLITSKYITMAETIYKTNCSLYTKPGKVVVMKM